jgi:hypothetical protein
MDRYESIETLAVKLNQPKLYTMSSKGITTEDIAQMKFNEAQAYGFTTDEYGTLKTYLKNHKMKTEPSAISTSPVSPGPVNGKIDQVSNKDTGPPYLCRTTSHVSSEGNCSRKHHDCVYP